MGCAEYQERIIDQALAPEGAAPEPKLAQHLVICASCSGELRRRRALLARIDSGVAALVSADVPQSLAARVRQQIAIEEARPRSVFTAYRWLWLAGAGAAIATAAILLVFSMRTANRPGTPRESVATNSAPAQTAPATTMQSAPAQKPWKSGFAGAKPKPEVPVPHFVAPSKLQPAQSLQPDPMVAQLAAIAATPPTLEVLIPGNQPIAVRQIVFAARRDQLDENLLAQTEAKPIDPIEVKPIKIDSIAPPDGGQSNPGSGTGSR